jgi:hypothetical protein
MGKDTAALRNCQVKEWPPKRSCRVWRPQLGIGEPSGPRSRGPLWAALDLKGMRLMEAPESTR